MESQKECVKVVMLPWLAHGHITPFLELAKGLSHRNFICYICSTPVNLSSITNRIPATVSSRIHLLPLDLPPTPELPPHHHTTNGLPLHLHVALRKALTAAKPTFFNLLKSVQPDLLIHDLMLPWASATASALNIRVAAFHTSGAAILSCIIHSFKRPEMEFPFAATLVSRFQLIAEFGDVESYEREEKEPDDEAFERSDGVVLVNTSREMEERYLDYLSEMMDKKVIAIGAFTQNPSVEGDDGAELMEWLGRRDEFSTVLVSFGSEYFLKKEEIEAIANGLEMSNVSFIWIIRFPKGEEMKVEEALPKGFLERVGERGKIVEKWAPQAKILGHVSIGGFVSHCGWNSLIESIGFGVPIIAMPVHLDQPVNAKLVIEHGVGVEVKRDKEGRLQKEEIARGIRDVVVGKTGEILRSRVGEVRERFRSRSIEEMEGFAHLLAQLCGKIQVS